jgi:ABC-type dipeptide/oligopeptide/nickel transport system permease subunit
MRETLALGLTAGVLGGIVGAAWGTIAGLTGRARWRGATAIADLLLLPADALRAVPWLLLGALLVLVARPDGAALAAILAVALAPRAAVATRDLWARVPAGRAWWRALIWIPAAILPPAIAAAALFAATLGFLGLGVRPPTPELGAILSESTSQARLATWLFWAPATLLTLLLLPWLLLADALAERARLLGRLPWPDLL